MLPQIIGTKNLAVLLRWHWPAGIFEGLAGGRFIGAEKTRGTCKESVYRAFFHTQGCIYGVVGLRGIFQKCVFAVVHVYYFTKCYFAKNAN